MFDFKKMVKDAAKSKINILYAISLLSLIITWLIEIPQTLRVLSIFFFVVMQIAINTKLPSKDFFNKFLLWMYSIVLLVFAIGYLALLLKDTGIAIVAAMFAPFLLYVGLSIIVLFALLKSETIKALIISYIFSVIIVVILFSLTFLFLSASNGNGLKNSDNSSISNQWNYFYFSAQTFYSNSFGDIVPYGFSKILAVVELIVSTIIHIIILGMIIPKIVEYEHNKSKKPGKSNKR